MRPCISRFYTALAFVELLSRVVIVRGTSSSSSLASSGPIVVTTSNSGQSRMQDDRRSQSAPNAVNASETTTKTTMKDAHNDPIQIVFSDVDGTLVHYPKTTATIEVDDIDWNPEILHLPPSSTGMRGIISHHTLSLCQKLRQHCPLVLISGMRTSTLWERLPFLPRADAYCSEAGRIFYPITNLEGYTGPVIVPQPGCTADTHLQQQQQPFGLVEDIQWRASMERTCGTEGFVGMELDSSSDVIMTDPIPIVDRPGLLWKHAQTLIDRGVVIDSKGYSTCFRVNRSQQTNVEAFDLVRNLIVPTELATSTNLGCIDFYPKDSGKKNCCLYLAKKLCNDSEDESILATSAICLCDDDNDLEMALACQHAYVPSVSSESMAQAIKDNPTKLTVIEGIDGVEGTSATELALTLILARF